MSKEQLQATALLALRAVLGVIFMAHGMQKLFGFFGGSGIKGLDSMFAKINLQPALFWAWVVALSEGLGGLLLILGVVPRVCASLIAIIMVVAIVKVHGANGFFAQNGGIEYPLLILAVALFIVLVGSGKFSLFNKF